MINQQSIVVSVCGSPNVGKSTIVNLLCGKDLSIVTHKPQTTRTNIKGVLNKNNLQIIFLDTPGVFTPRTTGAIERSVAKNSWVGIRSGEQIILVVDAKVGFDESAEYIIKDVQKNMVTSGEPSNLILLINKIDCVQEIKLKELNLVIQSKGEGLFSKVFHVSAKMDFGFIEFIEHIQSIAPIRPWYYKNGEITDQDTSEILAEITRKYLLTHLEQEIPYLLTVSTTRLVEDAKTKLLEVHQVILVARESHKIIVIGKRGAMLKNLLWEASQEMEKFLNLKIRLNIFVKVAKS